MISTSDLDRLTGNVRDTEGDKAGSIGQVYLDNETGRPEWVTVKTGLFGTKESFVPLAKATIDGNDIRVPYDTDTVKHAPKVDADGELSPAEEQELYRYYGLTSQGGADSGSDSSGNNRGGNETTGRRTETAAGTATAGPTNDDAMMTRSEEKLTVGTRTEETGRARLRKHVVTEQQSVTVPVSHEEARVEREPITNANRTAAMSGPDISENEYEVTLHAERPVSSTETVPVERVKLGTETVRDEETVSGDVRKEQIEVGDNAGRDGQDPSSRR